MSTTAALFLLAYVCTVLSRLAGWGEDMGNEGRFIVMVMEKCQGATVDPEPNPSSSRYSGQEQRGRCTHVMHTVLYCMHHAHSLFPFLTSTRRKIKAKRKKKWWVMAVGCSTRNARSVPVCVIRHCCVHSAGSAGSDLSSTRRRAVGHFVQFLAYSMLHPSTARKRLGYSTVQYNEQGTYFHESSSSTVATCEIKNLDYCIGSSKSRQRPSRADVESQT